jgi:apolipoprotein N-acyltransferase
VNELSALARACQAPVPSMAASFFIGAACTVAFAPFHWFWVAPLAFGLILALIEAAPSLGAAASRGFAFGLGYFLGGVSWVYVALNVYGSMPMPLAAIATFGFCAYLAIFPALAFWLLKRVPPGAPWLAAAPAFWVLTEWLRGWLFTGFAWQAIGYSQTSESPLVGWGAIVGVYGVSLAVVMTSASVGLLVRDARTHFTRVGTAFAVFALLALWIGGALLSRVEWTMAQGAPFAVSLLQGNIPQELKWRDDWMQKTLQTYSDLIDASDGARLIVLPEAALPLLSDSVPVDYLERIVARARAGRADVLIGLIERSRDGEIFNSVFSVGTSPVQVYRKHHLVPFGEFVPPMFGWALQWLNIPVQGIGRGQTEPRPMSLADQKVAINICYEDTFGGEIVLQLPEATILVNVSNTAWFGRSWAQPQHLQIARMRAIETGRPVLRATNTGMTAAIDPHGRVIAVAEPFTKAALRVTVQGYSGVTPFVRYGNALVIGLAALLAIAGTAAGLWLKQ